MYLLLKACAKVKPETNNKLIFERTVIELNKLKIETITVNELKLQVCFETNYRVSGYKSKFKDCIKKGAVLIINSDNEKSIILNSYIPVLSEFIAFLLFSSLGFFYNKGYFILAAVSLFLVLYSYVIVMQENNEIIKTISKDL
jgi:hypothetical protein